MTEQQTARAAESAVERARQLLANEAAWDDDHVAALIAELCAIIDQHTDPDLAARLLNMSKNGYDPDPHEVLRAAARKLGGAT